MFVLLIASMLRIFAQPSPQIWISLYPSCLSQVVKNCFAFLYFLITKVKQLDLDSVFGNKWCVIIDLPPLSFHGCIAIILSLSLSLSLFFNNCQSTIVATLEFAKYRYCRWSSNRQHAFGENIKSVYKQQIPSSSIDTSEPCSLQRAMELLQIATA